MPLTIQTTTACSSKKSFDGALMVDSASKAFLGCTWCSDARSCGCASTLVDLQRRLADRAKWIVPCRWINSRSIVDGAFDQVLRDHPDLRDAVNAQVSVLYSSLG